MLVTMMEYSNSVARSKAFKVLACRRDRHACGARPAKPGGQPAAGASGWVISADVLVLLDGYSHGDGMASGPARAAS